MEALSLESRRSREGALHSLLTDLCARYGLDALVLADEDGLVMGSTTFHAEAELLAAWAPGRLLGEVPSIREVEAPTLVRAISVGGELVLLAAVGERAAAAVCLEEADPWIRALFGF